MDKENMQPEVNPVEIQKVAQPQAELLTFGNSKVGLQGNFERFRKKKAEKLKMKQQLVEKNKNIDRQDPVFKQQLREKFIDTAKKYIGVPYAKRYHKPGDPLYDAPLFLDCCRLTRQVCRDLKEDLGFEIDQWNQAY